MSDVKNMLIIILGTLIFTVLATLSIIIILNQNSQYHKLSNQIDDVSKRIVQYKIDQMIKDERDAKLEAIDAGDGG